MDLDESTVSISVDSTDDEHSVLESIDCESEIELKNPRDFSELPPLHFHKILSYLPLIDRIRCKRVSKNWQTKCQLSISSNPGRLAISGGNHFTAMPQNRLTDLLADCGSQLRVVKLSARHETENQLVLAANLFTRFPQLSLTHLDISWSIGNNQNKNQFGSCIKSIISRSPALKMLKIERLEEKNIDLSTISPISANLKKLELEEYKASPKLFSWLANNCTNLKDFHCDIRTQMNGPPQIFVQEMRNFFKKCNQLSRIALFNESRENGHPTVTEMLEGVPEFWQLRNLTHTTLEGNVNDHFVSCMVRSFPNLKFTIIEAGDFMTSEGVAFLAELTELREVGISGASNPIAAGISAIAANGILTKFCAIGCNLDNWACILRMVHSCPNLTSMSIEESPIKPPPLLFRDLIDCIKTNLPNLYNRKSIRRDSLDLP